MLSALFCGAILLHLGLSSGARPKIPARGSELALHPDFDPIHVNLPDSEGRLHLVEATLANDLETIQVLLSYHADISALEPASGRNAMTAAFSNVFVEAAWILLAYGGDPDAVDGNGVCARELARLNPILRKFVQLYDQDGAMAFEDPPGTWGRSIAEETGRIFYYNHDTKEITYHAPPSCSWYRTETNGHLVFINSVTSQSKFGRPYALCWRRVISSVEMAPFWVNFVTNQTMLDEPAEMPKELINEEVKRTGHYWYNSISGETTWQDPSEIEWRESWTDYGKRYWFHPIHEESSWHVPERLAWIEVPYEDGTGKIYWWNEVTHESRADKPIPRAWEKRQFTSKMSFDGDF